MTSNGVDGTGFSFVADGVVTPRGKIAWNDLMRVRMYDRAAQKHPTFGVTAAVRTFGKKRVDIDFVQPESKSFIPARIVIDGTYLRFQVESGDIVEPLGGCWRVMALEIAPALLDVPEGEDASYLLPVFGGLVTPAAHSRKLHSVDRIYFQQSEWEKYGQANAFGVSTKNGSMLGIVHGGEFRAWVETLACPGEASRQFAVIGIREEPYDMVEHERKELLYRWLPKAHDYSGMSLAYRDYLLEERELLPLSVRAKSNPALDKVLHSMRFNVFTGMKVWPFKPDGSSPYFASTSFDEAGQILDEARAAGFDKCWVVVVGWIKDGHDGAYPSHFPVNERAGGEKALRKLLAKIRSWDWPVSPHDNIQSLYTASQDFDRSVAAVTRGGETEAMGIWSGGLTNLACPQVWMTRFGGEFERIKDVGFNGVYYIDALSTALFRCHDPRHPANEREFALAQARVLAYVRNLFGASAAEMPSTYLLKYIDYGHAVGSADRARNINLIDGDTGAFLREGGRHVPFFSTAVHGIIQMQGDWLASYRGPAGTLPLYVDGGMPSVEVCMHPGAIGDYYRDSLKTAAEPYKVFYEIVPELGMGLTTEFEEYAPDAVHYAYDNGIEVFVNATDKKAGGLPPYSLKILRNGKIVYKGKGGSKNC